MRGAGDDEIELRPLPEEFPVQLLVVKQQQVIIQQILRVLFIRHVIPVADVFLIAHGHRENPAAVEGRIVIVEGLGGVSLPAQQACQGLVKMVGHIVKGVSPLTAQEGAGIDAELGIEGPDATVNRGVEVGEVDALLHQAAEGGGMLPDHPVIHGLHQHQHHIFPLQQARHGVGAAVGLAGKIGVDLLPGRRPGGSISRGLGIDHIGVNILGKGLVQSADLIQPVGVEHIAVSRLRGLGTAVIGSGIPDAAVVEKHRLRQIVRSHCRHNGQQSGGKTGQPAHFPPGESPKDPDSLKQQPQHAQPPYCGIAEQHLPVIRALRGIAEIRKPQHFGKQDVIPGLDHRVHRRGKIEQTVQDPSRLPGKQPDQSPQNDPPQGAKSQGPQLRSGKALPVQRKEEKSKQLDQEERCRDQEKRQALPFPLRLDY